MVCVGDDVRWHSSVAGHARQVRHGLLHSRHELHGKALADHLDARLELSVVRGPLHTRFSHLTFPVE